MKNKFRKAIDCMLDKNLDGARKYIEEGIQQNLKYIAYKKQLSEMGLDLETVTVDEKVYDDLSGVLKDFTVPAKLKIIDELYKKIAKPNRLEEAKKKILKEQKRRATKNA